MIKLLTTAAMFPVRLVAIRSTDGKELPPLIEDATEEDHAHSRKKKESIPDYMNGKYSSEGAAREWSTVVDISIHPPSFKPVSLSFSRSPLSKTPKQVFFNPINIFDSFTHSITVFQYTFSFNVKII